MPEISVCEKDPDGGPPELLLLFDAGEAPDAINDRIQGRKARFRLNDLLRELAPCTEQVGRLDGHVKCAPAVHEIEERFEPALTHKCVLVDSADVVPAASLRGCIERKHFSERTVLLQLLGESGWDIDEGRQRRRLGSQRDGTAERLFASPVADNDLDAFVESRCRDAPSQEVDARFEAPAGVSHVVVVAGA